LKSGKNIKAEILTINYEDNATSLYYTHAINIKQPDNFYQPNFGKFILFQNKVYVEYRVFNTNFVTLRSLLDLLTDENIKKVVTYDS